MGRDAQADVRTALRVRIVFVVASVLLFGCSDSSGPAPFRPAPPEVTEAPYTPTVDERCAEKAAFVADIDGDEVPDRAYKAFNRTGPLSGARVGVCTSTGVKEEIEGKGMGEDFWLIDQDNDGVFLIVFGGNSAQAGVDHVAQVRDGHLQVLDIELPYGLTGSGPRFSSVARWGCTDGHRFRSGSITSVVMRATSGELQPTADGLRPAIEGSGLIWERRAIRVSRSGQVVIAMDQGQFPASGPGVPSDAYDLFGSLLGPCRRVE